MISISVEVGSYRLSPSAASDLEGIWLYTAEMWSGRQADSYYSEIMDMIESLAAGERQGRKVDARQGYLKYPVGKHHAYFRRSDSGIEFIRILRQSTDVNLHLRPRLPPQSFTRLHFGRCLDIPAELLSSARSLHDCVDRSAQFDSNTRCSTNAAAPGSFKRSEAATFSGP